MSLNSSIFTALSIGALLVACGDSGSGGSGGTSSGGSSSGGGTTTDGGGTTTDGGGTTTDGGGVSNGGAPVGGASGAVCADLPPEGVECPNLDETLCECYGCGAECNVSDCVCPACEGNTEFCADDQCNNDNECDPYSENCNCADCFDHPQCP